MKAIVIEIPGVPVSYKNPDKFGRMNPKYREWRKRVATICQGVVFQNKGNGIDFPHTGPIAIRWAFYLPRAKSNKFAFHTKKPDLRNLEKGFEDGMSGIIFKDDAQVWCDYGAEKHYVDNEEECCARATVHFIATNPIIDLT